MARLTGCWHRYEKFQITESGYLGILNTQVIAKYKKCRKCGITKQMRLTGQENDGQKTQ